MMHFFKDLKVDEKYLLSSIYIMLSLSCGFGSPGTPCAHLQIESPKPVNGVIAVEENTTVNITFTLVNVSCPNMSKFVIEIESKFNSSNVVAQVYTPQCDITVQHSVCHTPVNNKLCSCVSTNGPYRITKKMARTENKLWRLTWKWSAVDDVEGDMTINFNITDPVYVMELTNDGLEPFIVSKGQPVRVTCALVNSNVKNVFLLDSHGNMLQSKFTDRESINHEIQSVSCHDAGKYVCKADNSDEFKSATLLVKCPPEFGNDTFRVHNITNRLHYTLSFTLRMHSTNITNCEIRKDSSTDLETFNKIEVDNLLKPIQCGIVSPKVVNIHQDDVRCKCRVYGTPPTLKLAVELRNVRVESTLWRVAVNNCMGYAQSTFFLPAHFDSFLNVSQKPDTLQSATPMESSKNVLILILAIAGIAAIICFSLLTVIAILRHKLCRGLHRERSALNCEIQSITNSALTVPATLPVCYTKRLPHMPTESPGNDLERSHLHLNPEISGIESCVKLMCQTTDVTKVVFYLKGQKSNSEQDLFNEGAPSESFEIQNTSAAQYSKLEISRRSNRDNLQTCSMTKEIQNYYLTPYHASSFTTPPVVDANHDGEIVLNERDQDHTQSMSGFRDIKLTGKCVKDYHNVQEVENDGEFQYATIE